MAPERPHPPTADDIELPEWLGEFRILRTLGWRGPEVVCEAVQEHPGRMVALRVLPTEGADTGLVARFRRDAAAAARLHHTHIAPVYGSGRVDGFAYQATQPFRGCGLDEILTRLRQPADGPPPPPALRLLRLHHGDRPAYHRAVAGLTAQAADALAHAHARGVVHRDIHPACLWVDEQDQIRVTQLGWAKVEGMIDRLAAEVIAGTPPYLAPERFDGHDTPAGDVYALGAVLYELLTLRPPFAELDLGPLAVRARADEPPRPRALAPGLARDLEAIVLGALAKDPGRRPTAVELAADLRRFADGEPVRARPAGRAARLLHWARQRPATAALALNLVVTLVVTAGLGWQWLTAELRRRDANAELALARQELADARATADAVTPQRVAAEAQRAPTRDSLRQAQAALDESLVAVTDSPPPDLPGLSPLRRELLDAGRQLHERFLAEHADNPDWRPEVAHAHASLGRIRLALGDAAAARRSLEKAEALCGDLLLTPPADASGRLLLARACAALADGQSQLGELVPARDRLRQAVGLLEPLAGGDPAAAELLARSQLRLGGVLSRMPHPDPATADAAAAAFEHARGLYQRLAEQAPDVRRYRRGLAAVYSERGLRAGRPDAALADLLAARKLYDELLRQDAGDLALCWQRGQTLGVAGPLLLRQGRPAEAADVLRTACADLDALARHSPGNASYRSLLGASWSNLALALSGLGRHAEAADAARTAIAHQKQALEHQPPPPSARGYLANHYLTLARAERELGHPDTAAAAAGEFQALLPAGQHYPAARELAQCIPLVGPGVGPPTAAEQAERDRYAGLAITALRGAIRAGFRNVEALRTDPALAPLRGYAEFRALLDEVQKGK